MSILVYIVSLVGFNYFYNYTCGANSADVKVMKPMAQKISDYIIKNGIPESLKDIPDLPYGLVGCKKEITYADAGYTPRTYRTEKSQWEEKVEICHFKNITLRFRLAKDLIQKDATWNGSLIMDSSHDTGLWMEIEEHDNEKIYFGKMSFSGSTKGICRPWKQ